MLREEDPDAAWVRALTGASPIRVEAALREASDRVDLFSSIARAHQRHGRTSYVEIDAPLELYAIARLVRPRAVVEVGVSSGVSSAYLLAALHKNRRGTLHSVDLPQVDRRPVASRRSSRPSWSLPEGTSSGWAIPTRLRNRWDLRLGDKRALLPVLGRELTGVGLFVYDVPHDDERAFEEFSALDPALAPGAVVIVDHGPGGGECPVLRRWARRRGAATKGRAGLGLYGFGRTPPSPKRSS